MFARQTPSPLVLRDLVQMISAKVDAPDLSGGHRAYRLLGAPTEVLSASTSVYQILKAHRSLAGGLSKFGIAAG